MPKVIVSESYRGDGFVFPANVELLVSDDFLALLKRKYADKFTLVEEAKTSEPELKAEEIKVETVADIISEPKETETVAATETTLKATKAKK